MREDHDKKFCFFLNAKTRRTFIFDFNARAVLFSH